MHGEAMSVWAIARGSCTCSVNLCMYAQPYRCRWSAYACLAQYTWPARHVVPKERQGKILNLGWAAVPKREQAKTQGDIRKDQLRGVAVRTNCNVTSNWAIPTLLLRVKVLENLGGLQFAGSCIVASYSGIPTV